MHVESAVDREFEPQSLSKQTEIGICCFSAKYTTLSNKSRNWLAWNLDNMCLKWSDMSICSLFSCTIKIQLGMLV